MKQNSTLFFNFLKARKLCFLESFVFQQLNPLLKKKSNQILGCITFFMLLSQIATSQILTVKDKTTQEPLIYASVFSKNLDIFLTTNTKGQVDISKLKNATRIEIQLVGYKTRIKSYKQLEALNFIISLEHTELFLDEVVVSGTRWKQRSNNIPSKISSILTKDIVLQNPQTAADLLAISGKVFVQKSQQGGGSPMIRGFATNRLLYTVDGIRMNTAIFRGGNIQNVINLDPFAIEKTEVFFGPGSVIYGSDAIGGVMSFTTLTPQLSKNNKLFVSGKSTARLASANNEKTAHLDLNLGWEKWALVSSITSWDFDHLRQGSNGPNDYIKPYYVETQNGLDVVVNQSNPLLQIPTAYAQFNFMQKVRFKPSEKWDLQYGFHYSKTSNYGRYDRHNRTRNGTARYAEWNYGPQKWVMSSLNTTYTNETWAYKKVQLRLAQQWFEESRIDRSLHKTDRSTAVEKVNAFSINLDFLKEINSKNTLFYGAEYVSNKVASTGEITDISNNTTTVGPSRYPESTWKSMGMYVNNEHTFSKTFTSQIGLRYNYFKLDADFKNNAAFFPLPFQDAELQNGAITGSIGGVYRPSESWVFRTNFATAFRAPNVDDIGKIFDSEPGALTVPNPNLKAEYAYSIDFGAAKVFDQFLKIDATIYYTQLKNALVRRDFLLNGQSTILYDGELSKVQAIQNAAEANVYGFQTGFKLTLNSNFNLSSDFNYQVGSEELDDGTSSASRHAAPFFGSTRFSYHTDRLEIQLYSDYQGRRDFEDLAKDEQGKDEIYAKDNKGNNYSPSWYTLNLKSTLTLTKNLTANLGVENLTDQRYRSYSSGVSAAGRNFILSVNAIF